MDLYDIAFKGEVMPGADAEQVKNQLAALFKVPIERLDTLFDGQSHNLKTGLERAEADRYHKALKSAGAMTYLRRNGAGRKEGGAPGPLRLAPRRGNLLGESERKQPVVTTIDTGHLSLAPLDEGPLSKPKPAPPAPPNTDHIHLE